jgi:hypothetical protein
MRAGSRAELIDVGGVVGTNRDLRYRGEPRQPVELAAPDDLVADQDVAYAAGRHDLSLADLLAADTDRSGGDLHARDLGALVGLCVRAQCHTGRARGVRHSLQVALQGVQVNEQGRRIHLQDGHANDGRRAFRAAHGRRFSMIRARWALSRTGVRGGVERLHWGLPLL